MQGLVIDRERQLVGLALLVALCGCGDSPAGPPNSGPDDGTPTLRNVELTGPYMHDGVFATLENVVRFYDDGAEPRHPAVGDALVDPFVRDPIGLTNEEVAAVVAFLRALTDPGTALDPTLLTVPDAVPSGLEPVFGVRAP